ncbi:MAG: hypothetical protein ACPGSD_09850 [Flavobacteriales bacterium]
MKFILVSIASLFLCNVVNGQDYSKLKQADELYCDDDKSSLVLEVLEECLKDTSYSRTDLGYVHCFMGEVYYNREEYDKAIIQYEASLENGIRLIPEYFSRCHKRKTYWNTIVYGRPIMIGRSYKNLGKLDSADYWFRQAQTKYKKSGCYDAIMNHYFNVDLERIELLLIQNDTLVAQGRLINGVLFYRNGMFNKYNKRLKELLLAKYSENEIEKEFIKSIDHISRDPLDSNHYVFTLFGSQTKVKMRVQNLKDQKRLIKESSAVRQLLLLPPITRK